MPPEAEAALDFPTAEASEEDHNESQQVIQSKNSFKYKSSHLVDQIIGNKESPKRTRSHFRPEEFALGLLSMIEPTKVDEALTDDGWILALSYGNPGISHNFQQFTGMRGTKIIHS